MMLRSSVKENLRLKRASAKKSLSQEEPSAKKSLSQENPQRNQVRWLKAKQLLIATYAGSCKKMSVNRLAKQTL
jgi:hypothetical protein